VIEAAVFRTISGRLWPWESLLRAELLRVPEELAWVDALLDGPAFFAPFAPYFHPVLGRPCTPVECYLRLRCLKFQYRLGHESLCAEVSDSISWRRFCRIGLDRRVQHPTMLIKLTTRCGEAAVAGLNEALRATAGHKLLRTARLRADTTVIAANVAYPTDSGLLAPAVGRWPGRCAGCRPRGGRHSPTPATSPTPGAISAAPAGSRGRGSWLSIRAIIHPLRPVLSLHKFSQELARKRPPRHAGKREETSNKSRPGSRSGSSHTPSASHYVRSPEAPRFPHLQLAAN
jgi:IS5 family transposase